MFGTTCCGYVWFKYANSEASMVVCYSERSQTHQHNFLYFWTSAHLLVNGKKTGMQITAEHLLTKGHIPAQEE